MSGTVRFASTPWVRSARNALTPEKLAELESLIPDGSEVSVGIYRGKKGCYQATGLGTRTDYPHSSIEAAIRSLVRTVAA